jgi:hypothetical protein
MGDEHACAQKSTTPQNNYLEQAPTLASHSVEEI